MRGESRDKSPGDSPADLRALHERRSYTPNSGAEHPEPLSPATRAPQRREKHSSTLSYREMENRAYRV
jgi:hypothetical protein